MPGRPSAAEAAEHYFKYINKVVGENVQKVLREQLEEMESLFAVISEDMSLQRYAPDKWSIRELLNHVTDTERAFAFRALWFARGFPTPLPDYDQNIAAAGVDADKISWADHCDEFRQVRLSTISLFANMPAEAWSKTGVASNSTFSVNALAFITAGHVAHHIAILRERYL
jgi:hypothetical protein